MTNNNSPVFPISSEPHHFSDYGFVPQINYFQVLEEARKQKCESLRPIEALHFKLQKPAGKVENTKKKKWWRNALLFWRRKGSSSSSDIKTENGDYIRNNRGGHYGSGTVSGPVYITESRSGSGTPCRTSSRPTSGPLLVSETGLELGLPPYMCLTEFNLEQQQQQQQHRVSTSVVATPIYLVT
ncbi:hypothetical protein GIB67_031542 [Kingdonia uniflora]|uniref:Uncharacterized protein n=1 Tax=Kingdonia uniflora TaxID=39325 RepID=A0A7J7PBA6_9MAGN|nr:hypothetical protein GIB67_031542 [Kingdonia uniflora]